MVQVSPFGAFFSTWNFTSLLRPPVIEVKGGKIDTTVWTFFTLRVHQSEIEMTRLAFVALELGDIISIGTAAGVGHAKGVHLKADDQVEAGIEGIGILKYKMA